eukprot:scaffold55273_cov33-Prasinocladus_malaysianus.AAC.1
MTGPGDDSFDDDLDFASASAGPGPSAAGQAESQSVWQQRLLDVLCIVAPIALDRAAAALERLLRWAKE